MYINVIHISVCVSHLGQNCIHYRVLTSLENLEISGNFVTLENSGKTQGI